jgi:hypothetical protein
MQGIGQQHNDVDQHSHTADLLAVVSRAIRSGREPAKPRQ